MGPVFGVSKTSISGFVAVGPHCAQQKTCCRIGGWNHHSGHRAIIFCDNCTPRSAIVFLTPGQLAGQMHAPRIHFKEHMNTEKTRLQHQIWPQKRGQFLDLQFAPFPIEGWFWGPLVGPRNGPRNSAFFLLLLPYHLGLNIWPAWPQLQRFSACQTGFTTKGSTCSKCPCTIIIICDQHSYYDCKHTHTQWGPTATKPEMLVFETPKTGLLKVSLRTHNHMLSTQLPRVQAYTHTHTERGSMDARHGFLQKEASFFWTCCVQCRRNTARHTRQHSQCLDHDCACGNGIQTNILGTSLTWKPAMRFGAWI